MFDSRDEENETRREFIQLKSKDDDFFSAKRRTQRDSASKRSTIYTRMHGFCLLVEYYNIIFETNEVVSLTIHTLTVCVSMPFHVLGCSNNVFFYS